MSTTKSELLALVREQVLLAPLGLRPVWVTSLSAAARTVFIDSLFDASGAYTGKGGRERLLAQTVGDVAEDGTFVLAFDSAEEAGQMRPDVAELLFDVAQRLSLIRESDRQALKNVFSAAPSGAGPSV